MLNIRLIFMGTYCMYIVLFGIDFAPKILIAHFFFGVRCVCE